MISRYAVVIVSKQVFPSWCYVIVMFFFFSGLILYYDMILYHSHPHCNFGTIYWGDTRDGIKVISILSLGNSLGVGNPMEGFFLLSQPIKRIQGWCKESGAGLACPVLQTTSDLSSNAGGSEPEEMDQATIYQWDWTRPNLTSHTQISWGSSNETGFHIHYQHLSTGFNFDDFRG